MTGTLYLAATPIGNPADASSRLRDALLTADIVAAEDSRRAVRLFRDLDVVAPGRLVSFYDAIESQRSNELIDELLAGHNVVVITDAGMPSVSDPGYRIVSAAIAAGVQVRVLPGPSAVLSALAVSGLPVDRFCFEGFLPRQAGARATALRELHNERRTMVFFEAPHRTQATVNAMCEAFGPDRSAAICREMTKTHEEIVRGTLADLVTWADREVLGEVTIVVAGVEAPPSSGPQQWLPAVSQLVADGMSTRDAVAEVAAQMSASKREVYDAVLAERRDSTDRSNS